MSVVLGIETSRELCSAAVFDGGAVRENTRRMARAHNQHILELVDGVMAAAGLAAADLDAVAFGCGPGSFTGIRIAASVAQAVALGAEALVVPVSSTLALATAAAQAGRLSNGGVFVSIQSRRDAVYLAGFALAEGKLRRHHPDTLVTADPGWPGLDGGWAFVGDRPTWLPPGIGCYADVAVGAGLVARMGAAALVAGEGVAPELGLPVYVSGDAPWKPSASTGSERPPAPHTALEPRSEVPGIGSPE